MAIEALISKHIQEIQSFGCRLWFYFDGLDCAFENTSFTTSIATAKTVADAFTIYETGDATKAIDKFRQAGKPQRLACKTKLMIRIPGHGDVDGIYKGCSTQAWCTIFGSAIQSSCAGKRGTNRQDYWILTQNR
jgi:hypothetical protein